MHTRQVFRYLTVLALVATVIAAPAVTGADGGTHFAYDFSEGYVQQYKVNFKQEMFRGSFSWSAIVDLEVTEKCVGVSDEGAFEMEIVFDKVEASMMMFDKMRDSGIGESLTGQAVSFTVDKHGETNDVKAMGYIESWNQVEQIVTELVNQFYVHLPAEDHSKGDKWEFTDEKDEQGMNVTENWEYEFKEVKQEMGRECAKVQAEVEFGIGGISSTPGGDFKMDGGGDGKYEFFFDGSEGLVVKLKGAIEINSDMTPVDGKGDTNELTINYEISRELL